MVTKGKSMDRINLIPKRRRLDRQRRIRSRLWIGAVLGYAVTVLAVCLVYGNMVAPRDLGSLSEELAGLDTELASLQQQRDALQPKLNEQYLILTAGQSITDQPDWSLLLTYLADEVLGDRMVLTGCTLAPAGGAIEAHQINDTPMALTLTGYGRTTPDVSQLMLRLEQMSLFDKVTLARTNREPFLSGQAIAFEARCVMQPDGGGS
jgi:Tfp pilus assembly protein PilN